MTETSEPRPAQAVGVNHLVLNVRDLEASHRFYTEILGWEKCGELNPKFGMQMQFYRSAPDHHHDIALVQLADPASEPEVKPWELFNPRGAINHYAVAYPDRDSWLQQLNYLKSKGVEFHIRGNHGMTHSAYISDPDGNGIEILYELPNEIWEGDINAALNYFEMTPTEGPEALEDPTEYVRFGAS
jgi:catechol 2,3-dioxygenase